MGTAPARGLRRRPGRRERVPGRPDARFPIGTPDGPPGQPTLAEQLADEPALARYPELAAVRGTFLRQLGRPEEARDQFLFAARQTTNVTHRGLYLDQAHTSADDNSSGTAE
jgi:predicted RNA polymerase sigma factor